MPEFTYTARNKLGQMQKGAISAHNKDGAIQALISKQLHPVIVKEQTGKVSLNMNISLPGLSNVKSKDIVIFTRELATMVNAGVPLLRCLNILKDQTDSTIFKSGLEKVIVDVEAGSNLNQAMEKLPKIFSKIYVSMVRAGEEGGILDMVLQKLATQQEKDAALRNKIRAAMIYPAVIFTVTLGAFFILMTFIVPKIGKMLTQLSNGKITLPIYTRILLDISNFMKQPIFIITVLVGLPVALLLFRRYIKTTKGRMAWHRFILKLPVIKVLIVKTAIARFSNIFGSLMAAGVSIVDAIETTASAVGNAVIEEGLLSASKAVQAGSLLSVELEKNKNFPPLVTQMISVGEETGTTDQIILKVAEFYEDEVDTAVGALSSILEPLMIVLLGGMVGLIAISVFGPITKVETSVQ